MTFLAGSCYAPKRRATKGVVALFLDEECADANFFVAVMLVSLLSLILLLTTIMILTTLLDPRSPTNRHQTLPSNTPPTSAVPPLPYPLGRLLRNPRLAHMLTPTSRTRARHARTSGPAPLPPHNYSCARHDPHTTYRLRTLAQTLALARG